ncbi:putative bifunctional diguanylate cyclase/phosphodiesterase [Nitrincola alkalilacustris]|uniref:putative bifunctional diguanylate cyclase/phosphodiesterase n=1 Tax=Nitrincola alkalilacustris TaxID=1571224 RepID=UPI00124E2FB8|nr:EAL domain-containing protein [Nitrincola alkalilacustris]
MQEQLTNSAFPDTTSDLNEMFNQEILSHFLDGVITIDRRGIIHSINRAVEQIFGYTSSQLVGANVSVLMPQPFRSHHDGYLAQYQRTGQASIIGKGQREVRGQRADGTVFPMDLAVFEFTVGDQIHYCGILRDISARKQIETDLRIASYAFEAPIGMVVTDARTRILKVNHAFTRITGYTEREAIGNPASLLRSDHHPAEFWTDMWDCLYQNHIWEGEVWSRRKNGEVFPKWLTVTAIRDEAGSISHYIATMNDLSEQKASEEAIRQLALYDPLTGLPNRRLLMDRLRQAMSVGARNALYGALLFIDLDHFKTLNDTLGHSCGDQLLKQVADRLSGCIRQSDTVARLGGDEFVIMLVELSSDPISAAERTKLVVNSIIEKFKQPFLLNEEHFHTTPSIGATLFVGHRESIDDLLIQADLAMYKAKSDGRNGYCFFDPEMQSAALKRSTLEMDIRQGIQQEQFVVYYQPQVNVEEQIKAFEALLRWQHPLRGFVSPSEFIPLAEETGLIIPLGLWVIESACRQLVAWSQDEQRGEQSIAVNVSAKQIYHSDFVAEVKDIIDRTGADPHLLKMELTESLLLANVDESIIKMNQLRDLGIRFSLDDFGTGYSSLNHLKRLPLDQLKIDQSFVRDVLLDEHDATIARTIIALGESMRLNVIAEGVESSEQKEFLVNCGCRCFQGYLFGYPDLPEKY